jgi:hypothetical protein
MPEIKERPDLVLGPDGARHPGRPEDGHPPRNE